MKYQLFQIWKQNALNLLHFIGPCGSGVAMGMAFAMASPFRGDVITKVQCTPVKIIRFMSWYSILVFRE